jgi:hypothetical protein
MFQNYETNIRCSQRTKKRGKYMLIKKTVFLPSLIFFIFFCLAPFLFAGEIINNPNAADIEITSGVKAKLSFWDCKTGFFTGTIVISNKNPFEVRGSLQGAIGYQRRDFFSKPFFVPPSGNITMKIYPPIIPGEYSYFDIFIKCEKEKKEIFLASVRADYSYYSRGSGEMPLLKPKDAVNMPDNFRDYIGMPTVYLEDKIWREMSQVQQEALLDWVYIGGSVNFETKEKVFVNSILEKNNPSFFFNSQTRNMGLGKITTGPTPEKGSKNYLLDMMFSSFPQINGWQTVMLNPWILIIVVLVIALLMGPGSMLASKWFKRPILLMFVVPIFSIISCLILLLASFVSDGITPKLLNQTIAHLDQRKGVAFINQYVGIEAPLGLRSSINLPEEAVIYLPHGEDYDNHFTGNVRVENGFLKISNFILPRTPESFAFTKLEKRREKLDVREGNPLSVINGIGADISELLIRDTKGDYWGLDSVLSAGKQASLKKLSSGLPEQECPCYPAQIFNGISKNSGEHLAPGCYQATLAQNVFGEKIIEKSKTISGQFFFLVGRYASAEILSNPVQ